MSVEMIQLRSKKVPKSRLTGVFVEKTAPVAGRWGACCCAVGRKIYIFGGATQTLPSFIYSKELWCYDTDTDTWTDLTQTGGPGARRHATLVHVNGVLYLFGGYNGNDIASMWGYTIATGVWEQKATRNQTMLNHASGGYNGSTAVTTAWKYNVAGNNYTQLTSAPNTRQRHVAATIFGKIYMFSGVATTTTDFRRDLLEYVPDSNEWRIIGSHSQGFREACAAVVDDVLYSFFGVSELTAASSNKFVRIT